MAEATEHKKTRVEEFEEAFQSVCKYVEQMDEKKVPLEEIRRDSEILVSRLVEAGRSCEQFFLQKHLQIANAKPEQILREECNELRQEIHKKDQAIAKHHEKLASWQQSLRSTAPTPAPLQQRQLPIPTSYMQSQHVMPSSSSMPTATQYSTQMMHR